MSLLFRDIIEIARCCSQYRSDELAHLGLKSCLASFLLEVCANPGISQDGLARRIFINKSNVARQAVTLEEQGYIQRKPSAVDKRVMELYPTQKALELQPQIRTILRRWESAITEGMSQEDLAVMGALLRKMKERSSLYMEDR